MEDNKGKFSEAQKAQFFLKGSELVVLSRVKEMSSFHVMTLSCSSLARAKRRTKRTRPRENCRQNQFQLQKNLYPRSTSRVDSEQIFPGFQHGFVSLFSMGTHWDENCIAGLLRQGNPINVAEKLFGGWPRRDN